MNKIIILVFSVIMLLNSNVKSQPEQCSRTFEFLNPSLISWQIFSAFYYRGKDRIYISDFSMFNSDYFSFDIENQIAHADKFTGGLIFIIFHGQKTLKTVESLKTKGKPGFTSKPELILSYRLQDNIEIFGSISYTNAYTSCDKQSYLLAASTEFDSDFEGPFHGNREILPMYDPGIRFATIKIRVIYFLKKKLKTTLNAWEGMKWN